jgi:hypothetical protein
VKIRLTLLVDWKNSPKFFKKLKKKKNTTFIHFKNKIKLTQALLPTFTP